MPSLKVLAIHRFYWPDTPPYASMLRAIVRRWVKDGHQVDVLSSQPSYKSTVQNQRQPPKAVVDGAHVVRLNLRSEAGKPVTRVLNALRLGLGVFWQAVIKKRYDVIMVSTSPPVLAGWFVAIASRMTGARFIYHCMDVHPEIGRISGEFRNPRVFSLLARMDGWACAQANPVVVLSSDMANALGDRKQAAAPITRVINNFSLPSDGENPDDLPFSWPDERFVLLFAGNIGRFQGLDLLIDAMAGLAGRDDIRLIMMGEGTEKKRLAERAEKAGARVSFVGHYPVEVAKSAMRRASAGFVSLVPDLFRYAYPSKTMTYLEQGCPVLAAVEPGSCLARDIETNGVGVVVPNGDAGRLVKAITSMADEVESSESMKQKALEFAAREFSPDAVLYKWSSLLTEHAETLNE